MRVLVTGGAGYVGSHVARRLAEAGLEVVVYDNLSRGHPELAAGLPLVRGDVGDGRLLADTVRRFGVEAAVHLAADSLVGESVADPRRYFANNVVQGLAMLDTLLACGVRMLVFSSSAAVYGEPERVPIPEEHPLRPTSPYGESKAFLEAALRHYRRAYGLRYVSLRYFNAAGAHPRGDLGEDHRPETHLIPLALLVALGRRPALTVHGDDYPTPDGTAVRDYVHVCDLAEAHLLALEALRAGAAGGVYNLGTGRGHSVREVVEAARRMTGHPIPCTVGPRRPGDPAVLVASGERAERELGWRPRHGLEEMVATAWRWHRRRHGRPGDAGEREAGRGAGVAAEVSRPAAP